jgi:hypothetical protein
MQKGDTGSMATSQFRGEVRAPDFPSGLDWINSDHPIHIRVIDLATAKVETLDIQM